MVTGDGDRVPSRQVFVAVRERVADQPQRVRGRVDVGAAGDVLLEDVVLHRPAQPGEVHALLLGDELVQQQQHRGGRVDRHGGRDLGQRQAVEQQPHVVQGVDRDADLAHLAGGQRVVGVQAHLGRQVEGDAQTAGAGRDELVVALVGLPRATEPGVLAHRPRPGRVHPRVNAPGVRVGARLTEALRQAGGQGVGTADRLHGQTRLRPRPLLCCHDRTLPRPAHQLTPPPPAAPGDA